MTYVRPKPVSEIEAPHYTDGHYSDGTERDCVWTSGVMLANARDNGIHPATLTEAERLRLDAGKDLNTSGSTVAELNTGYSVRYRYTLPVYATFAAVWKQLVTGRGAVVTGLLGNLPAGHRLRRFSPNYTGGHAVYVGREDDALRVWWIDPLAPQGTYTGEWVSSADLSLFMASNATAVIADLATKEDDVTITLTKLAAPNPRVWNVAAGVTLVGYDATGKAVKTVAFTSSSSASADASGTWTVPAPAQILRVTNGTFAGLFIDATKVTLTAAAPTYTKADVDAAYAKGKTDALSGATPLPAGVYKVGA